MLPALRAVTGISIAQYAIPYIPFNNRAALSLPRGEVQTFFYSLEWDQDGAKQLKVSQSSVRDSSVRANDASDSGLQNGMKTSHKVFLFKKIARSSGAHSIREEPDLGGWVELSLSDLFAPIGW